MRQRRVRNSAHLVIDKMKEGSQTINSTNTTSAINTVSDSINKINNDDNTLEVIGQLQNMSTADNDASICANCGKEGANNTCNKCKQVNYCNAACKKKHRHKHKKDCEEHLKQVAELHDEKLFKLPPQQEDCPICFLLLPLLSTGSQYNSCCGKMPCCGCIHAMEMENRKGDKTKLCPFCRTPEPQSGEKLIEQMKKRVDIGDTYAMNNLGYYYSEGMYGLQQNMNKAFELRYRAAELGHVGACFHIGNVYQEGRTVNRDMKKAVYYWEQAAIGGDAYSRHNLGAFEWNSGNIGRALKHWLISVVGGNQDSLKCIQELYLDGDATKDEYSKALRAYQKYLGEVKSSQRDEAVAFDEDYKYTE